MPGSLGTPTPRPADERPQLREIPHDILKEISQYLDRRSAFNLTLTCKSLREAGEMKLWEAVDVTFDIRR